MPTDAPTYPNEPVQAKQRPGWVYPLGFIVVFALALVISGLHKDSGVNSAQEYMDDLKQAQMLSTDPMTKNEKGEPLSSQDMQNLRKAANLYDDLGRFKPEEMGPYVLGGRIHLLLEERETAERDFKQALDDAKLEANSQTGSAVHSLTADAHDLLARTYEEENRWPEAMDEDNQAIAMEGNAPIYYYDRARSEIQLKQLDQAAADLRHAVVLDPQDSRFSSLLKFLLDDSKKGG